MNLKMLGSDFRYRSIRSRDDGTLLIEDIDLRPWIKGEGDLVYTMTVVDMDSVGIDGETTDGGVVSRKRSVLARCGTHEKLISAKLDDGQGYDVGFSSIEAMISRMVSEPV